jgi:hypothetical protein
VHNFVSESQWDYRALVDQVAKDANILLGGNAESRRSAFSSVNLFKLAECA